MASDRNNQRHQLESLLDGIVESILDAPEEEIDDDLKALGEDPEKAAMESRRLALEAVAQHRTQRREQARQQYEDEQQTFEGQAYDLPETPRARLALLVAAVHGRPHLSGMLTVEHRDLRGLPDEDVVGYLRQLAELGVLDEL